MAGIFIGARIAHNVSTKTLARLVAAVLFATGVMMAARVIYGWVVA